MSVVKWEVKQSKLKLCVECQKSKHIIPFIYEMMSRWLIPGQQLELNRFLSKSLQQSMRLEAEVSFSSKEQVALAARNRPYLEKEILVGTRSFYQAAKILEMKGLSLENKTVWIQEKILKLIRRFPKKFDYDLITQMQQFLVKSDDNFKKERSAAHMGRIIYTLYDFQKRLDKERGRPLFLKFKKERLLTPFGEKKVEAIFLAIGGLGEHEIFEKRHLLKAIQSLAPALRISESSLYSLGKPVFYIECEEESEVLKKGLASEVMTRIEQRMPSIFMPRNEEEIMRTLLVLSQQLKYAKDMPQMALHFDGQTDQVLIFTVMIARLTTKGAFIDLFNDQMFSIEKVKEVGLLRKKIPKEAVVMRAKLSRDLFVRDDYSVDVFAARLFLTQEITKRMGEVRDYNGGIIAKQGENFARLKTLLGKKGEQNTLLLQNFFHALFPAPYGATCDPHLLKILFLFLLKSGEGVSAKRTGGALFIVIKEAYSPRCLESLCKTPNLITTAGANWAGIIYLERDEERQKSLLAHLRRLH